MAPRRAEHVLIGVFICLVLIFADRSLGQGIDRESLSGESVAEEMRQSSVNQVYNLRLGPVTLRTEADLTASFNDNIGLTNSDRVADILITPSVALHGRWQVTYLNTLNLDLGIGYQTYLFHPQYDSLLLSPDSQAQFLFFIGDILVKLHDSFSYQEDPVAVGQISNTTRLSRFQNDAGLSLTYDLDTFILSADYDHVNFWVTQNTYKYLTNQSDTFAPTLTFKVNDTIDSGLNVSLSDVRYDEHFENNYTTASVGPFVKAKITDNLSIDAQAGGYFANYDRGGANGDTEDVASYYGSFGITHRINDFMTQSLTAGREFIPGLTSNFTQRIYTNYTYGWKATSYINAGATLFFENLEDSDATFRENSDRYGLGLSLDYSVTDHATLNLNYQFILKNADPSFLSYYQDLATIGFGYSF